jgi:hypothetical protein
MGVRWNMGMADAMTSHTRGSWPSARLKTFWAELYFSDLLPSYVWWLWWSHSYVNILICPQRNKLESADLIDNFENKFPSVFPHYRIKANDFRVVLVVEGKTYIFFVLYAEEVNELFYPRFFSRSRSVNRYSSFGTRTSYGLDGRGSIPVRGKIFLFSTASRLTMGPTQSPTQWVPGALSLGVTWHGREADHSPSSSAEFDNGGAICPLPHTSSWHSA